MLKMKECIYSILRFALTIFIWVTIFRILSDTRYDAFQQPFASGEKEILFNNKVTNPLVSSPEVNIKCEMYQNIIMNPKVSKLGDIFNLNIKLIHDNIESLLIVTLCEVLLLFSSICIIILSRNNFNSLSCIITLMKLSLGIANLVLLNKVFFIFYKSNINQFMEFLQCKNINRPGFGNYLYAEDLYEHFASFVIANIIDIYLKIIFSENNKKTAESSLTNNDQYIEMTENI